MEVMLIALYSWLKKKKKGKPALITALPCIILNLMEFWSLPIDFSHFYIRQNTYKPI